MGSLRGFAQLVHSSLPTGSSQVEPQGVNTPSFRLLAGASSICKQLRNAVGTVICIPLRGAPAEQGWGSLPPKAPEALTCLPSSSCLLCPAAPSSVPGPQPLGEVLLGWSTGAGAELRPCSGSCVCWLCFRGPRSPHGALCQPIRTH